MSRFCVECRTVLRDERAWGLHVRGSHPGAHRVLDLQDPLERVILRELSPHASTGPWPGVWSLYLLMLVIATLGVSMGLQAVWPLGAVVRLAYCVAFAAILGAAVATNLWRARQRARRDQRLVDGEVGVVNGAEQLVAPLSGLRCVAWGLRLRRSGGIVLQEQITSGFCVRHAGGEVVVEGGLLQILGRWNPISVWQLRGAVRGYLTELDPLGSGGASGEADPFACDAAEEIVIANGDRVSVHGRTVEREVEEAGLRSPARMGQVSDGVPVVELLPASAESRGRAP